MGSFCKNHMKFQLKKYRTLMTLNSDAKFKEKLICGFKYDMRNFVNFHPTIQKSKNFTLMGYFCPKYMRFELKKIQRSYLSWQWTVMQNLNSPDLAVSKMAWGIGWTFTGAPKSLKNCTLMSCFCPKHIMFQLENVSGIMCHNTEGCCKI